MAHPGALIVGVGNCTASLRLVLTAARSGCAHRRSGCGADPWLLLRELSSGCNRRTSAIADIVAAAVVLVPTSKSAGPEDSAVSGW